MATAAALELPPLRLGDALALVLLYHRAGDGRFERARRCDGMRARAPRSPGRAETSRMRPSRGPRDNLRADIRADKPVGHLLRVTLTGRPRPGARGEPRQAYAARQALRCR